jgi:hypothetical protein
MQGSVSVPFLSLFTDTVRCHGVQWSARYYAERGMPVWEFLFWLKAAKVQ